MNISLLTVIFISACSLGKPPFKVIQLLWMNLVMDVFAACAICTEPFVHREDTESLPRESRKARIIRPVMWRNILPQALYQIVVMIILMFGGQAMFFDEQFDIITTEDYDMKECLGKTGDDLKNCSGAPTDKLRKDVACFHTYMLMNIINMINCRVVSESQDNVFKTLFNNKIFWIVFLGELAFQNGMIITGYLGPPF
jgi:magnesium-transporting ATPase (P-type)